MDEKLPQTHTTWGANENFAEDFSRHYELAQAYFRVFRSNPSAIVDIFDNVHQIYVMEEPYLDEPQLGELLKMDKELGMAIKNCSRSQSFMRSNRLRLYDELDIFFRRLNRIAVEKKFFPMAAKTRTLDQKLNDAMQQR